MQSLELKLLQAAISISLTDVPWDKLDVAQRLAIVFHQLEGTDRPNLRLGKKLAPFLNEVANIDADYKACRFVASQCFLNKRLSDYKNNLLNRTQSIKQYSKLEVQETTDGYLDLSGDESETTQSSSQNINQDQQFQPNLVITESQDV